MEGKVKFFNHDKGYGFIISDQNEEIFVHKSGVVLGRLQENDKVTYELQEGKKGILAVDVRIK